LGFKGAAQDTFPKMGKDVSVRETFWRTGKVLAAT
jgi:hypothetical protein